MSKPKARRRATTTKKSVEAKADAPKKALPVSAETKKPPQPAQNARKESAAVAEKQRLDRRSQNVVVGLMGILLITFVLIALLAPDPTRPQGTPGGATILWRLLFLLLPLGVMYGLLWWEKIFRWFKRS